MRQLYFDGYKYRAISTTQRLTATYIFAVILVSIIHFYIYEHFWFLRLLGLDIYTPKINYIFLLPLFYIAAIYQLVVSIRAKDGGKISKTGKQLAVTAFLYFVSSFFTVIMHELDFSSLITIKYFFYLSIPVMLSLSVFALFRDNENIKRTLFVLFLLGIAFSVFATVLRIKINADITAFYDVFSMDGKMWVSSGTGEYLSRFSIPGVGPTNFPSMLIPLILAGIYFFRNSDGKMRYVYLVSTLFLFLNITITSTRGALISLLAGMLYLFIKGWFKSKKPLFTLLTFTSIVLVFFTSKGLLYRLVLTIYQFIPSIGEWDVISGLIEKGGYSIDDFGEEKNRGMMLAHAVQQVSSVFGLGFSGASSHVMYVDVLIRGGLVLLVPLVLFILSIYCNCRETLHKGLYKDAPSKDLGIVLIAIFLSYTVEQMFMPAFVNNYWIWFGFAVAWARNCEMEYRAPAKVSGAEATKV